MSEANVASRYADALIEVAAESNKIDAIGADLVKVENLFQANGGQLAEFIASPVFTVEERSAVLDKVLPKVHIDPYVTNLLKVMNANRRLGIFSTLRAQYDALADERSGRVRVQVTTADALTPALESEIKAALEASTGKSVIVEHTIDPSLIGGMIARVGGKVYDSSLRTRLSKLKHALIVAEA